MLFRLILVVGALSLIVLGLRWLITAPPKAVARLLKGIAVAGLLAVGGFLLVTGRLAGILAVVAGLVPSLIRILKLHAVWREVAGTAGFGAQRTSAGEGGAAGTGGGERAAAGAMTRAEAWEVLGLSPGASPDEIRAAHRRMMQAAHPDHGGSTWVASRLNQARDLLLDS